MANLKLASSNDLARLADATVTEADINAIIEVDADKDLLRLLTCGSVDDGKSTLIGRLLYDSRMVMEDQLSALERDSRKLGTTGGEIDLALLVDGLQAEREQGITIDVAFRYFATPKRKFVVADAPGHEQYTRNMATGSSISDLAVILVDARNGIQTQTRRHSCIIHLLGIRNVVLAVNKMDQIDYDKTRFEAIQDEYAEFAASLGIKSPVCIPISALKGDNVTSPSANMQWYHGPTLLAHLETVEISRPSESRSYRMPVQRVNRPSPDFRGYSGTIAAGTVSTGDEVVVLPSAKTSKIARIVTYDGDLDQATAGRAVTLVLEDELDISRGDVLCATEGRPEAADQAAAHVIWMSEEPMLPGRRYRIKCGTQWASATISALKHKLDVDNLAEVAGRDLALNEIGYCNLSFDRPLVFDPYDTSRHMGGFILVDRLTNETVGAGLLRFGLRRATNIHWQAIDIAKATRAEQKGQKPACLWFTGLSGSGKSTIANILEKKLHSLGRHTYILDGDNVRHGLNRDLGFTDVDRVENIRRVGEVARLLVDAGLIVLVSFISPFRSERQMARALFDESEFLEVYMDVPLDICEQRDPKGLYKKARAGEIANFTGISSDYEIPANADIHLRGGVKDPEELVDDILAGLTTRGMI